MFDNESNRSRAAKVVDPLARFMLKMGLTPNMVTVASSSFVSLVIALTWSQGEFLMGMLLCVPFVFGDLLDGTMARLSGTHSRWGGFLDSVMDRVTDGAIIGSLTYYFFVQEMNGAGWASVVVLVTTNLIPYIRAKAESLGLECKVGIMERSERLFFMLLLGIAGALNMLTAMTVVIVLFASLNVITVGQRLHVVSRQERG